MTAAVITIAAFDAAPAPLPASLASRLNVSPTKSPEELVAELAKHSARTELLRKAHLDAVKDRAARDNQRVTEAAMRKRRLAAYQVEKVQRRLEAAETKLVAKREAAENKRAAWSARRAEFASNVAENRKAADELRQVAHMENLEAEKQASAKHEKTIQAIHDKSAAAVKHAVAVVAAQKEKRAIAADELACNLADRLAAAELRRSENAPHSPPSPNSKAVLVRVLNEQNVDAALRGVVYSRKMGNAEAKRNAFIGERVDKAKAALSAAKAKADTAKAKAQGIDAETAASKSAHYDKLNNAEISRLSFLKQRTAGKWAGDTTSVIIVNVDKTVCMPPPALVKRLTTISSSLSASAATRQAGALARRTALRATMTLKLAKASARRAAVLGRVQSKHAKLAAAIKAKAARSLVSKAIIEGRRAFSLAQQDKRAANAAKARKLADSQRTDKGTSNAAHCGAVNERRDAVLRRVAKAGVVAVRAAASKSRREAQNGAKLQRLAAHAERCDKATIARASKLALVVATSKKSASLRTSDA